MIRTLYPTAGTTVDDVEAHVAAGRGEPGVWLNMVSSLDGAATVGKTSSGLGDADDKQMFAALRAAADVILVGAETVRVEGYGSPRLSARAKASRTQRGMANLPRMAVVSRSLSLDPGSRFFQGDGEVPLVFTGSRAPNEGVERLGAVAEVVVAGVEGAAPGTVIEELVRRGYERILCEGGPTFNSQLLEEDLVDEVNLTLSPIMVGGDAMRIVSGSQVTHRELSLAELLMGERVVFLRYVRARSRPRRQ